MLCIFNHNLSKSNIHPFQDRPLLRKFCGLGGLLKSACHVFSQQQGNQKVTSWCKRSQAECSLLCSRGAQRCCCHLPSKVTGFLLYFGNEAWLQCFLSRALSLLQWSLLLIPPRGSGRLGGSRALPTMAVESSVVHVNVSRDREAMTSRVSAENVTGKAACLGWDMWATRKVEGAHRV
jgi:hypothetical protein